MARAEAAGLRGLMCCGSSEEDWPLLPALARRYPAVRLSFGLHPWYVAGRSAQWLDTLRSHLVATPSGVGEVGLDHAIDPATFAAQEEALLAQIRLANELRRPVSFHCRRAWGRFMELLDNQGWPACGFVIHSYSGSAELVMPLARRGAYFSFSGAITFEANRKGRDAVTAVPAERLLVETDAPDIPPALPDGAAALRDPAGKAINEPANLIRVIETAARLRGTDRDGLAEQTWENALAVFGT